MKAQHFLSTLFILSILQGAEANEFKFYEHMLPAQPVVETAAPAPEAPAPEDESNSDSARQRLCFPDLNKWGFSSVSGVYYQREATILTRKNNERYIEIWVSRLKSEYECNFEKEFVVIDCVRNAKGDDWYNATPVDPDDEFFVVLKDICASFPSKKMKVKVKKSNQK